MTIDEFFKRLGKRCGDDMAARSFFYTFLRLGFLPAINRQTEDMTVDWDSDFDERETWIFVYYIATVVLWDAACKKFLEIKQDVFAEATRVARLFCQELEESLDIETDFIPIESPANKTSKVFTTKLYISFWELTPDGLRKRKISQCNEDEHSSL